jgi:hypothetical protein
MGTGSGQKRARPDEEESSSGILNAPQGKQVKLTTTIDRDLLAFAFKLALAEEGGDVVRGELSASKVLNVLLRLDDFLNEDVAGEIIGNLMPVNLLEYTKVVSLVLLRVVPKLWEYRDDTIMANARLRDPDLFYSRWGFRARMWAVLKVELDMALDMAWRTMYMREYRTPFDWTAIEATLGGNEDTQFKTDAERAVVEYNFPKRPRGRLYPSIAHFTTLWSSLAPHEYPTFWKRAYVLTNNVFRKILDIYEATFLEMDDSLDILRLGTTLEDTIAHEYYKYDPEITVEHFESLTTSFVPASTPNWTPFSRLVPGLPTRSRVRNTYAQHQIMIDSAWITDEARPIGAIEQPIQGRSVRRGTLHLEIKHRAPVELALASYPTNITYGSELAFKRSVTVPVRLGDPEENVMENICRQPFVGNGAPLLVITIPFGSIYTETTFACPFLSLATEHVYKARSVEAGQAIPPLPGKIMHIEAVTNRVQIEYFKMDTRKVTLQNLGPRLLNVLPVRTHGGGIWPPSDWRPEEDYVPPRGHAFALYDTYISIGISRQHVVSEDNAVSDDPLNYFANHPSDFERFLTRNRLPEGYKFVASRLLDVTEERHFVPRAIDPVAFCYWYKYHKRRVLRHRYSPADDNAPYWRDIDLDLMDVRHRIGRREMPRPLVNLQETVGRDEVDTEDILNVIVGHPRQDVIAQSSQRILPLLRPTPKGERETLWFYGRPLQ